MTYNLFHFFAISLDFFGNPFYPVVIVQQFDSIPAQFPASGIIKQLFVVHFNVLRICFSTVDVGAELHPLLSAYISFAIVCVSCGKNG